MYLSCKFKKGKYYIGDPCYAVDRHDDWIDLLNQTKYFMNDNQSYNGYPVLAGSTAYGDGVFIFGDIIIDTAHDETYDEEE